MIQRDYTNRSYLSDYYYYPQRDQTESQTDIKSTDSGRRVYGGGGITPDEKYATPPSNAFQGRIICVENVSAVFHFGSQYFGAATTSPCPPRPGRQATTSSRVSKPTSRARISASPTRNWKTNRKWIGDQLRLELLMRAYDLKTATRTLIQDDPEVRKAIDSLPKAQSLLLHRITPGPTERAAIK